MPPLSMGLLFFMNCFRLGFLHKILSFRNRHLQCGSLIGSLDLPENLLLHGILFKGHRPYHELVPAQDLCGLQNGYEFHHECPWSSPLAADKSLFQWQKRLLPTSSLTLVSAGLFLSHSSPSCHFLALFTLS